MQKADVVVEIERLPLPKSPLPSSSQGAVFHEPRGFATLIDAKPYMEERLQEGYRIRVTTPHKVMDHEKVLAWLRMVSEQVVWFYGAAASEGHRDPKRAPAYVVRRIKNNQADLKVLGDDGGMYSHSSVPYLQRGMTAPHPYWHEMTESEMKDTLRQFGTSWCTK
jgi:hypothetical protein